LESRRIYDELTTAGVDFYTGVPDSLLKDFCAYVTDHAPAAAHVIAANEGAAVALAAGHHLATGKLGLVYMQNSGIGNAVNPLLSLADRAVYSIPMLLLIGWRGEPGRHDEPQHLKQGAVTLPLLEAMGIAAEPLPADEAAAVATVKRMVAESVRLSAPAALIVRAGTFAAYSLRRARPNPHALSREAAVRMVVEELGDAVIVSTTGMTSRELYEIRAVRGEEPGCDFLTVGSMGHASQIALGIALAQPQRHVCCLDGDGAVLMHMGALALIGSRRPRHFTHVVINNGAHDSVGGQPTAAYEIDLPAIALGCGYRSASRAEGPEHLRRILRQAAPSPRLIEVRVHTGARGDLGRPKTSPQENKAVFASRLRR
jgi:phosphonopyruvate decarboxylase